VPFVLVITRKAGEAPVNVRCTCARREGGVLLKVVSLEAGPRIASPCPTGAVSVSSDTEPCQCKFCTAKGCVKKKDARKSLNDTKGTVLYCGRG
jgi:hypothetical protein